MAVRITKPEINIREKLTELSASHTHDSIANSGLILYADRTGNTSSTDAIQDMFDASSNGDVLRFPSGTYFLNGGVKLANKDNITLVFEDGCKFLVQDDFGNEEDQSIGQSFTNVLGQTITGNYGFIFDRCNDLKMRGVFDLKSNGTPGRVVAGAGLWTECQRIQALDLMRFDTFSVGRSIMDCSGQMGDIFARRMDGYPIFYGGPDDNGNRSGNEGSAEVIQGARHFTSGNTVSLEADKPACYMSNPYVRSNRWVTKGDVLVTPREASDTPFAVTSEDFVNSRWYEITDLGDTVWEDIGWSDPDEPSVGDIFFSVNPHLAAGTGQVIRTRSATAHALAVRNAEDCTFGNIKSDGAYTTVEVVSYEPGDDTADPKDVIDRVYIESVTGESENSPSSTDTVLTSNSLDDRNGIASPPFCPKKIGAISIGTLSCKGNSDNPANHAVQISAGRFAIDTLKIEGSFSSRPIQLLNPTGAAFNVPEETDWRQDLDPHLHIGELVLGEINSPADVIGVGNGTTFNCDRIVVQGEHGLGANAVLVNYLSATPAAPTLLAYPHPHEIRVGDVVGAQRYSSYGLVINAVIPNATYTFNPSSGRIKVRNSDGLIVRFLRYNGASYVGNDFTARDGFLFIGAEPDTTELDWPTGQVVYSTAAGAAGVAGWRFNGTRFEEIADSAGINVKAFGAVGDGNTDDTEAIQAAIDAADKVFFPAGTYRIMEAVTINSSVWIEGAGSDVVTFLASPSGQDNTFYDNMFYASGVDDITITNCGFNMQNDVITAVDDNSYLENILCFVSCSNVVIEKNFFQKAINLMIIFNASSDNECENIYIRDNRFEAGAKGAVFLARYGRNVHVTDNRMYNVCNQALSGISYHKSISLNGVIGAWIENNYVLQDISGGGGIIVEFINRQSEDVVISGNRVEGSSGNGIKVGASVGVKITKNSCVGSGVVGLYIEGCYDLIASGNYIDGSDANAVRIYEDSPDQTDRENKNIIIEGNIFKNSNEGGHVLGTPVTSAGSDKSYHIACRLSTYVFIRNNDFIDDSASTAGGIWMQGQQYYIEGNNLLQTKSGIVTLYNTATDSDTAYNIENNAGMQTTDKGRSTMSNGDNSLIVTPEIISQNSNRYYVNVQALDVFGDSEGDPVAYAFASPDTAPTFSINTRNSSHGAQAVSKDLDFSWEISDTNAIGVFGKTTL